MGSQFLGLEHVARSLDYIEIPTIYNVDRVEGLESHHLSANRSRQWMKTINKRLASFRIVYKSLGERGKNV